MPLLIKKPAPKPHVVPAPAPVAAAPAAQAVKPAGKSILPTKAPVKAPVVAPVAPAKPLAAPVKVLAPTAGKPLPIKPLAPKPAAPAAPVSKPGVAIGLKPIVKPSAPAPVVAAPKPSPVAGMSQEQQKSALKAGLIQEGDLKYEQVGIGTRVVIVNDLFPWVKHYKPGDEGVITKQVNNIPSGTALGSDDQEGHAMWVIKIDKPIHKDREGQTAALFRKEFKPVDKDALGKIPSKKVLMGE